MNYNAQITALRAKLSTLNKKQYYALKGKINKLIRKKQKAEKNIRYYEWLAK